MVKNLEPHIANLDIYDSIFSIEDEEDSEIQVNHTADFEVFQQPFQVLQRVNIQGPEDYYKIRSSYTTDFEVFQQPFQALQSEQVQGPEDSDEIRSNHTTDLELVQQAIQALQSEQVQGPEDSDEIRSNHTTDLELVQQPLQTDNLEANLRMLETKQRSPRQIMASRVRRRIKWTDEEEWHLTKNRHLGWTNVAKKLNNMFHGGQEARSDKICRERWRNHLDPNLKSNIYIETGWTPEEDRLLLDSYRILGGSWSSIAKRIKGRTEHAVKNRYYQLNKHLRFFASGSSAVAASNLRTIDVSDKSTATSDCSSGREDEYI